MEANELGLRLLLKEELQSALIQYRFRKWLESKPEETIVGFCGSVSSCPIAIYLKEHDYHSVIVEAFAASVLDNFNERVSIDLPSWSMRFIDSVDTFGHFKRINAKQALLLLKEI